MAKLDKLFDEDPRLGEKLVRRNTVYQGRSVDFRVDEIRLPNGATATREFLDHPGAVGIVPVLPGNKIVLVRQYRYPVGAVTLELPAGKFDKGSDESAEDCARRELREETGYAAKTLRPLITYWPTAAFANEILYLFIADRLIPGAVDPDEDEFIEKVELPLSKALALVKSGRIKDSKTVIGLLSYALWHKK